MEAWTKVVTSPLGLAGFALFLIFTFLGSKKRKPSWLPFGAYGMAAVALIGGLFLAYRGERQKEARAPEQRIGTVQQSLSGTGANTAGVQGSVTTTIVGPVTQPGSPPPPQPALTHEETNTRR
jgi:hypothetical protein